MLLHTFAFGFLLASSSGTGRIGLYAAGGSALGVFLFYRGFRMLQYKRLILNTPFSKIRSASMGLVEVSGNATGPQTVPAGITGAHCYYYRATAWELRESGRTREWQKVADESLCLPFFVEDSTGRLLVNPQGADLDGVHRSFKDEFSTSLFSSRNVFPENIRQFMLRNGIGASGNIRLEEHCIQPGYPLFILGMLSENTDRGHWSPQPHTAVASSSVRIQSNVTLPIFGNRLLQSLTGIPTTALDNSDARNSTPRPSAIPLNRTAAGPAPAQSVGPTVGNWSAISMDDVHRPGSSTSAPATAAASLSQARSAASTAVADDPGASPHDQAPASAPEHADSGLDSAVVIGKGAGHDPFAISSESQRDVVRSLQWKSAACIWGGPILTLVSLYVLFGILGWR